MATFHNAAIFIIRNKTLNEELSHNISYQLQEWFPEDIGSGNKRGPYEIPEGRELEPLGFAQ